MARLTALRKPEYVGSRRVTQTARQGVGRQVRPCHDGLSSLRCCSRARRPRDAPGSDTSAYDSTPRAAFLGKLREVASELLPVVHFFYGSPSTYRWWDAAGRCRDVYAKAKVANRGIAPALFAFGQHDAPQQASDALHLNF